MGNLASAFDIKALTNAITNIREVSDDVERNCSDELSDSLKIYEQTVDEEKISLNMLNMAKAVEAAALANLIAKEAEVATASAEEASAIASGNPILIAAASAKLAEAIGAFNEAKAKHDEAKAHRERLEHRYEMAVKCLNIATQMLETERMKFNAIQLSFRNTSNSGIYRLSMAKSDLEKYVARISPSVRSQVEKWEKWKPSQNEPVAPKQLHDRLNVDKGILQAILAYLYATDENFRNSVNNYREQGKVYTYRTEVEKKIKKNMTGRLCEEIVIRAFEPMGERVETQGRTYFDDGSYTKTDLVVKKLKVPVILGRGEGMGAREGADLAIEVKSGQANYLYAQKEHMKKQALGHQSSGLSCTVCTRDIKKLSPEKEEELRNAMIEAGSPLLGMLPTKDELDNECIYFVFGDEESRSKSRSELDENNKEIYTNITPESLHGIFQMENYSINDSSVPKQFNDSKEYKSVINSLEKLRVEYRPIKKLNFERTSEEIINRLSGGDLTEGSCSSLAFAYAGNKAGYDVLDFRDGESRRFFSNRNSIQKICELPDVDSFIIQSSNDTDAAQQLLEKTKAGKEYYLAVGSHAAIVRKSDSGYEYLELQHPSNGNGWHKLDENTLKYRFRCFETRPFNTSNFLVDVDSMAESQEFKNILGYINTAEIEQRKGLYGNVQ